MDECLGATKWIYRDIHYCNEYFNDQEVSLLQS